MQVLNICMMSVCAYLFLRYAPFKRIISLLIVFGYFFIYEYHIISRNYALSVLLIAIVFILLSKPVKNHYLIVICLLLLSLTHLYSIIISSGLCLIFIYLNRENKTKYFYFFVLVVCLFILYSLKVPADHFLFKYDNDSFLSFKRIGKAFSIYLKGMLPFPDFTSAKVWNTNLIVAGSKTLGALISLLIFIIPLFIFKNSKLVLFFFYFTTLSICLFIYLSPIIVANRHCGFVFVILIFSFWLKKLLYPLPILENSFYNKTAFIVLLAHVLSGFYIFFMDLKNPFSNSKNIADFIKLNNLDSKEIYLSNLSSGPPVSAYLNKKIFYLETGQKNSFCKWNTWPFILNINQFHKNIFKQLNSDTSLLILNKSYLNENFKGEIENNTAPFKIILIQSFDDAMLPSENYNLYYILKN